MQFSSLQCVFSRIQVHTIHDLLIARTVSDKKKIVNRQFILAVFLISICMCGVDCTDKII